jgi:hypothetical protein
MARKREATKEHPSRARGCISRKIGPMVYGRVISFFLVNIAAALASISTFAATPFPSQSVALAWTASPSSTIAGYRLYYGGASRDYTNTLEAGDATSVTVADLAVGATYFFAVTAYDIVGLESSFSDEISYTVPGSARLAARALAPGQILLTGRGPVGYGYDIQASQDLQNWTAIGSVTVDGTGTFRFADPGAATNSWAYYRLRQTSP